LYHRVPQDSTPHTNAARVNDWGATIERMSLALNRPGGGNLTIERVQDPPEKRTEEDRKSSKSSGTKKRVVVSEDSRDSGKPDQVKKSEDVPRKSQEGSRKSKQKKSEDETRTPRKSDEKSRKSNKNEASTTHSRRDSGEERSTESGREGNRRVDTESQPRKSVSLGERRPKKKGSSQEASENELKRRKKSKDYEASEASSGRDYVIYVSDEEDAPEKKPGVARRVSAAFRRKKDQPKAFDPDQIVDDEEAFAIWDDKESISASPVNQAKGMIAEDFLWLAIGMICLLIAEQQRIDSGELAIFDVIFELVSAYGTSGLSLGFNGLNTSLSTVFTTFGKLVVIMTMFLGRHRGLPQRAIDETIRLPNIHVHSTQNETSSRRQGVERTRSLRGSQRSRSQRVDR